MDLFSDLAKRVSSQGQVSIAEFVYCLLASALLSGVLTYVYVRFGRSLSNRKVFAANFIPITLTTMFIISVVKSSLALSLGLVGALSIVRFRTAIREPEELIYLFVCIAIGLGFGAAQWKLSLIAFSLIIGVILVMSLRYRKSQDGLGLLVILQKQKRDSGETADIDLKAVRSGLSSVATRTAITRIDAGSNHFEASLAVEGVSSDKVSEVLNICRRIDPGLRCMIMDSSGKTLE